MFIESTTTVVAKYTSNKQQHHTHIIKKPFFTDGMDGIWAGCGEVTSRQVMAKDDWEEK